MKRKILMLSMSLLFVMLLFAMQGRAQQSRVSLQVKDTRLEDVFKEIERKTGYVFFYNNDILDINRKVTINVQNADLSSVLKEVLSSTNVTFQLSDKHIIISGQNSNMTPVAGEAVGMNGAATSQHMQANNAKNVATQNPNTLRGTVRDETGMPLPGALIAVKETKQHSTSNDNGVFEINDVPVNAVLAVSFLGYKTVEYKLNGRNNIEISLEPDMTILQDVMVTGYQVISKERATGAFGKVSSDAVERRHSSDVSAALLGTVAGLQGKENADGSVDYTIRGITSLYADKTPLVVVDGFPVANGFKDINPNDVESVTVLKDAAAASIWGARSANGVIVVTTKRAKEKLHIELNAQIAIGQKFDLNNALTTASSSAFIDYEQKAIGTSWDQSFYFDYFDYDITNPLTYSMQALYNNQFGYMNDNDLENYLNKLRSMNNRQQIKDHLLQNPIVQQYNLNISAVGDRSQNYISTLYEHGKGNMTGNDNDRFRLNFNNQTSVFKWLDLSLATTLHYQRNHNNGATLDELSMLSPYEMILNEDGSYAPQVATVNYYTRSMIPEGQLPYEDWNYNILREVRSRDIKNESLSTRLQAGLTFKILTGLTFNSMIQYEYLRAERTELQGEESYYVRNLVNTNIAYNSTNQTITDQFIPKGAIQINALARDNNYVWRNQLNYANIFGKHNIAVVAGTETSDYLTEGRDNPYVYGFDPTKNTTTPLPYGGMLNSGHNFVTINGFPWERDLEGLNTIYSYRHDRYVSLYTNVSYTYNGKYNISGSLRSDASNLITSDPSYRWAPLWSIGGKWNIYKEKFMSSTSSFLDMLALRMTYGYNGNVDKSTSHYTLLTMRHTPSSTTRLPTAYVSQQGNPKLRWERTSTINIGADFAFLSNLLYGSVDVYTKQGEDIIGRISLPSYSGTSAQKINQASISNKGIEITLGSSHRFGTNIPFSYATQITYAYNKNKISELFNYNANSLSIMRGLSYVEGYPVDALWSYKYLGMEGGEPMVEGPNGVHTSMGTYDLLTAIGSDFLLYEGPRTPPHNLGWSGTLSIQNFSISFLLVGNFGGVFRAPTFNYYTPYYGSKNIVNRFYDEVGKDPNKIPTLPESNYYGMEIWGQYVGSINTLVESSSLIRMKEITLDYTMPQKLVNSIGIDQLKIYGQVRDLGCLWTANSYGYDPEYLPGSIKPAATFVLGINVNF